MGAQGPKTLYAVRRYVMNWTKSVLDSRTQESYEVLWCQGENGDVGKKKNSISDAPKSLQLSICVVHLSNGS